MAWKKPKVFRVDVYDIEIDLFDSIASALAYSKIYIQADYKEAAMFSMGFAALVTKLKDLDKGIDEEDNMTHAIVLAIPPTTHRATLLAHETAHAAHMILDSRGVPIHYDNTEAMAYLQDYIFQQCALLLGMDT